MIYFGTFCGQIISSLTFYPDSHLHDKKGPGIINNRERRGERLERRGIRIESGRVRLAAGAARGIGFRSFGRLDLFRSSDRAEITSFNAVCVCQGTSSAK